jgi:GAF domain-containing protein/anti-sigma regulatory factor (Ser/Thr protein kinase)
MGGFSTILDSATDSAAAARSIVRSQLASTHAASVVDDAALVASELVTNAVLHGQGRPRLTIERNGPAVRIGVHDSSPDRPLPGALRDDTMTGRGLRLVEALASRWGVEPTPDGKEVWAELSTDQRPGGRGMAQRWETRFPIRRDDEPRFEVLLGDVPTNLLLDAKAHMDNLVREFTLAMNGARSGESSLVPPQIAELTERVVGHFAEARRMIKEQALQALERGEDHVNLRLHLPASAAEAGADYLRGLDEAEGYCRSARLLTLESPPQHQLFRHWYVEEIITALRRAVAGEPPRPAVTFEDRLLAEIGTVSATRRAAEGAKCIVEDAAALAGVTTIEKVAEIVLRSGMSTLGAQGASIALDGQADELFLAHGWDTVLRRVRRLTESDDLDEYRVPLIAAGRHLGTLRFHFEFARTLESEETDLVLGLAALTSLALVRIGAEQQAQESVKHVELLTETGAVLADTSDIPSALDALARLFVPRFADWCLVHLLDEQGQIRCVAVRSADGSGSLPPHWAVSDAGVHGEGVHGEGVHGEDVPGEGVPGEDVLGVGDALRTSLPQLHPDLEGDPRGVAVVMPLLPGGASGGAALGALTFVRCGDAPSFASDDIALSGEIARRLALVCDNARLRFTSMARQEPHDASPTAMS